MKNFPDEIPEKTDYYFVRRKVHKNPTLAVFVHPTKEWGIYISGNFWLIKDVQLWAEIPEELRKKDKLNSQVKE